MNRSELKEVFTEQLKDIYSAEKQLVKALPKMAKAASTDELSSGFEEHLEQTKGHVQRLETIAEVGFEEVVDRGEHLGARAVVLGQRQAAAHIIEHALHMCAQAGIETSAVNPGNAG